MNQSKNSNRGTTVPTSEEFVKTLGQVTWLMTQSKSHRDSEISLIEAHVVAPLMFKQVRVYSKSKQPLAAIIWAYVSKDRKEILSKDGYRMVLEDWRSGSEIMIVDCISPFIDSTPFIENFMAEIAEIKKRNSLGQEE